MTIAGGRPCVAPWDGAHQVARLRVTTGRLFQRTGPNSCCAAAHSNGVFHATSAPTAPDAPQSPRARRRRLCRSLCNPVRCRSGPDGVSLGHEIPRSGQGLSCARAMAARARSRSGARNSSSIGGPDGGDGGQRRRRRGSNASTSLNTLIDFRYQQHFKAKTGMHGMGRNRAGGRGARRCHAESAGRARRSTTRTTRRCSPISPRSASACGDRARRQRRLRQSHFTTSTNRAPRRANPGQVGHRDARSGCG